MNSGVTAIATGGNHTCAVTFDGSMKCWGSNTNGELGVGNTTNQTAPVEVSDLSNVIAIATGSSHTCAIVSGGAMKCWGNNQFGQLGIGNTAPQATPVQVSGLASGVIAIAAGANSTYSLRNHH